MDLEVKFTKDFASYKKGEQCKLDSQLVSALIKRKVVKIIKKEVK